MAKDSEFKKKVELMNALNKYFGEKINKFSISQPLFSKTSATIKVEFVKK